ncbi:MAG: DUF4241 domain-containing protein [Leptolyngbya sp. SIOISBB]|nr:DUF4241 domain-containing protein [Leptolyngbya sp. SIOISBB]
MWQSRFWSAFGRCILTFKKPFRMDIRFVVIFLIFDNQSITIRVIEIGDLVLSSGKIVVQDPGNPTSLRYCLQRSIKPGSYPVHLSLACFSLTGECIISCAKIETKRSIPVRWEVAVSEDTQYPSPTYDVDSGVSCFMDFEASLFLKRQIFPYYQTDIEHSLINSPQDDADDRNREEFFKETAEKMDENVSSIATETSCRIRRGWSNFFIDELAIFRDMANINGIKRNNTNIISFGAGFGEGEDYSSYWGIDTSNEVCCLVTDFFIFFEKYPEHSEFHEYPDIVCIDDE